METVSEGKTGGKTISHYAGPGGALTWTSEGPEKWSRNIPGIDGSLCATQTSGSAPVLQLHDLQGNVIATAGLGESEMKLLSTYNSTEYGVPQPGTTPPKYAWLGAVGISSEPTLSAGTATQSGATYVPQVARDLQTAGVIPPGAFPNGQSGTQYTATISVGALASASAEATRIFNATEAERQAAKQREAEEKTCAIASECVEPGEGEVVDPSVLLTSRQSEALAYGLRYGGKVLEEAVRKVPVANVLVKIIVELGSAIATELAEGLEVCYTAINSYVKANARCKVYINLLFDVFPTSWGVETCFAKAYKRRNKVHYTYPYCTKA
jgi:hypothetical protein